MALPKTPPLRPPGRPAQPLDPNKAVTKVPRIKPASTRNYGKGGTPYSGSADQGISGAGIGYGGPPGFQQGGPVEDYGSYGDPRDPTYGGHPGIAPTIVRGARAVYDWATGSSEKEKEKEKDERK